jgi:hypothetical protein
VTNNKSEWFWHKLLFSYWIIYVLDVVSAAFFIALGYYSAKQNLSLRTFVQNPTPETLLVLLESQCIWIALGLACLFLFLKRTAMLKFMTLMYPSVILLLLIFSSLSLYGVATNIGFILYQLFGL